MPWLCVLMLSPLWSLLPGCSVRRLSVEQLIAEDAALDKSCTDALSFVRTCEQLRGYNKQVQPNQVSTCWPMQCSLSVRQCPEAVHDTCVLML